jgi:hypothetical protein
MAVRFLARGNFKGQRSRRGICMDRSLIAMTGLGALLLAALPAGAAVDQAARCPVVDQAARCKEAKAKETGKKASGLMKAFGKNAKKPSAAKLAQDLSKVQSKFTKGFSKADAKAECPTSGDAGVIEAKVDAFVFDMVANIAPSCGDDVQAGPDEQCDGTADSACPGRCIPVGSGGGGCGDDTMNGGGECTCTTEECDGTADAACPGICQVNCQCPEPKCGNAILEAGEECEPPCSEDPPCGSGEICGVACQCLPVAPCNCGTPDPPTSLDLTSEPGSGTCGELRNASDAVILELDCGYTYVGGGGIGVSARQESHLGTTVYPVACCYGTSLALTASTPAETGSQYNCSGTGCLVGGPVPIVLTPAPISTCVYNNVVRDAWGSADCSTGDSAIELPIQTTIFLTGDLMPGRCDGGSGAGRACKSNSNCVGGLWALSVCTDDSDCPAGTCGCPEGVPCLNDLAQVQPCPICNPATGDCNGGPNDGEPCEPHTPEAPGPYPTSYDCPPDEEGDYYGFTNLPWEYTTGTQTKEAADGQFCGFCRDVESTSQPGDTGSLCFEGDHRMQCPDSATGDCKPFSGTTDACGVPIPCDSDADCLAPYESCEQRNLGAFGYAPARKISATGMPPGDLRDRAPHPMTKVSVMCVPPTFVPFTDSATDFPSPGVSSVPGVFQLRP